MTIALPDLLLYCGALVILFLTPGPVWLAIMARALSGGFGAAWPLALGVAIGDMLWPLVAVLGISWILSVFDMFMLGMRWIACAVFLIMGVLLIRHADAKIDRDNRLTRPGAWAGFGAGLLAILGNPKAVLFYIGVLPGFFDLRHVTALEIGRAHVCTPVIPLFGNLAIAALVGKLRGLMTDPATLKRINIVAGALLICVGLLIPFV